MKLHLFEAFLDGWHLLGITRDRPGRSLKQPRKIASLGITVLPHQWKYIHVSRIDINSTITAVKTTGFAVYKLPTKFFVFDIPLDIGDFRIYSTDRSLHEFHRVRGRLDLGTNARRFKGGDEVFVGEVEITSRATAEQIGIANIADYEGLILRGHYITLTRAVSGKEQLERGLLREVRSELSQYGVDIVGVNIGNIKLKNATDNVTTATSGEVPKMRILFLAANPSQTSYLDLEEELRGIEQQLRGVKFRDSIKLIARHAIRPDDLILYVREDKPNVIHFSGHGSKKGIILRADSGGYHEVDGVSLRQFLEGRGVDLVVLNACYSRGQADTIQGAVRTVVGTTDAVGDEAARRFSVAFYRSLGNGLSVREAFRDGRDAVALHGLIDVFHSEGELDLMLVT